MSNLKGLLIITLFFFINGGNKKELSPQASEGSFLELNGENFRSGISDADMGGVSLHFLMRYKLNK